MKGALLQVKDADFPGRRAWEDKLWDAKLTYVEQGREFVTQSRQLLSTAESLRNPGDGQRVKPDDPKVQEFLSQLRQLMQNAVRADSAFQAVVIEGWDLSREAAARFAQQRAPANFAGSACHVRDRACGIFHDAPDAARSERALNGFAHRNWPTPPSFAAKQHPKDRKSSGLLRLRQDTPVPGIEFAHRRSAKPKLPRMAEPDSLGQGCGCISVLMGSETGILVQIERPAPRDRERKPRARIHSLARGGGERWQHQRRYL